MAKRQLLLNAFQNKPVERVPVGFWFHFASEDDFQNGLENPAIIQKNIDGHLKFYREFGPDFVKLMSDGFFRYPNPLLKSLQKASDLFQLEPIGANHPWITEQVKLVKTLTESFGSEVFTFYNVFAPATYFKILLGNDRNRILAGLILEDKAAVRHALNVIAEDLAVLSERVIREGKADGIYLSVQNVQDDRISLDLYSEVIMPGELKVLSAANAASEYNILHICGYEGSRNDLSLYVRYEAKIVNWAVNVENVSLEEGKKLFGGRTVIGGFDNRPGGLLHRGSREEIEEFTEKLIKSAGKTGIILGADCTVPRDIDLNRLEWVRSKAASL